MKRGKSFYLSTLELIKEGKNPTKICGILKVTKQRLNYYLSTLKRFGCIEKIGYGTWEYIKDFDEKQVKKTAVIGRNSRHSLKPNNVRGHGFLFRLDVPNDFKNWSKRESILDKLKIKHRPYFVGGIKRGQRITAQQTKVALTDRSILVNFPESYIAETATLAQKDAIAKFLRVVKHLERILRANFSQFGKYRFKVSRQHYSLIKNSLARQYIDNEYTSKKLHVYSGRGLWLLIDNSYNLEELETVHKKTSVKDNEKVQDFFNGLDMVKGYTPQFVLEAIAKNTQNLGNYAQHLTAHVESIKQLGTSVQELTKVVKEMKDERKTL